MSIYFSKILLCCLSWLFSCTIQELVYNLGGGTCGLVWELGSLHYISFFKSFAMLLWVCSAYVEYSLFIKESEVPLVSLMACSLISPAIGMLMN